LEEFEYRLNQIVNENIGELFTRLKKRNILRIRKRRAKLFESSLFKERIKSSHFGMIKKKLAILNYRME
jgi:hypothetical protein